MKLVGLMDELHESLAHLRMDAALAVEPMGGQEREGLTAALLALPLGQFESAVGLVLPRLVPNLADALPAVGRAGGGTGGCALEMWHTVGNQRRCSCSATPAATCSAKTCYSCSVRQLLLLLLLSCLAAMMQCSLPGRCASQVVVTLLVA